MTIVDVTVSQGPHPGAGQCVIQDGVAAVDLPGLDGPRVVPAAVVPEWIAALVDLGPRPRVRAPGMLVTSRPSWSPCWARTRRHPADGARS